MGLAIVVLIMLMAAPLGLVTAQNPITWTLGKSYTSYSTQSFKTGSTLEFDYDKTAHNVLVVSKSDYDSCNAQNPTQTFTDGKSVITLKQGANYFICGIPGHCASGMKLQVNAAESSGSTPTTPVSTPSSTPTPAGSGSTTPDAPSPKDTSAAAGFSGHMMVGVTLVFGAVFALV